MTGSDGMTTLKLYTMDQTRRMLPEGASAKGHAVGVRCKRAGATYVAGWPVAEIDQIRARREVVPTEVGDDPIEVYTFDQVLTLVSNLGWFPSLSNIRAKLAQAGTRALRGYSPPEKVVEAMRRPAGRDWRRQVSGGLAGRTFTE